MGESAISRYRKLNLRDKFLLWTGVALLIGLFIVLSCILRPHESALPQSSSVVNSLQSPVHPGGGKNNIPQIMPKERAFSGNTGVLQGERPSFLPPQALRNPFINSQSENTIESIIVETRMTYELKDGAGFPPYEVPFKPAADANVNLTNAYLIGPGGNVRLDFISPVGFKIRDDGLIVVTNHFALQNDSDFYGSPLKSLKNFNSMSIPFITTDYGSSLKKMVAFEAFLGVNGQSILHYQIPIVEDWQSLRVPLDKVKEWVDQLSLPEDR